MELTSNFNPNAMGAAAITALAITALVAKFSPQSRDCGQADGGVPDHSTASFIGSAVAAMLAVGPAVGAVAALVGILGDADRPWIVLAAWASLGFHGSLVIGRKPRDPQQRLILFGALSSSILGLIAYTSTGRRLEAASAALTTIGFLSIPRGPAKVFQGKIVDRQSSCSMLELMTFSWSRDIFDQTFGSDEAERHRGLKLALARNRSGAIASQWILTILKSITGRAPRLILFRLLGQLARPAREGEIQSAYLALGLGLCQALDIWLDCTLRWATLSSLVYEKALRLPNVGPSAGPGRSVHASVTTHLRLDSGRACMLGSTAGFLLFVVGWKGLVFGLLATALTMPITSTLTKYRDQRSALLRSALLATRQPKLSAAEVQELAALFSGGMWIPVILSGIPLYLFVLQGNSITPAVAFTCVGLFNDLQSGLTILPLHTTWVLDAWTSLRRLERFFDGPEAVRTETTPSDTLGLYQGTLIWPETGDSSTPAPFSLRNISIEFPKTQLSVITGETGSGKSLLLSALAGEATISGVIRSPAASSSLDPDPDDVHWILPHRFAVVSQSPWMIDGDTIRDNIIFGLSFDQKRYNSAIRSCDLGKDLQSLEHGDQTVIGAKGVQLSGGQRWRVALARALYSRAGVILMDDVLSAVDAEVRHWLVEEALCGPLAQGRTRILATHYPSQCGSKATLVVHLQDGEAGKRQNLAREPGESLSKNRKRADKPKANTKPTTHKDERNRRPEIWLLVGAGLALLELSNFAQSWWLKDWISRDDHGQLSYYGGGYILLSCFTCIGITVKSSESLFNNMTRSVFGAPLHKFTSDISTIDKRLVHDLGYLTTCACQVGSIPLANAAASVESTCIAVGIIYAYFAIGARLLSATRRLKHLSSVAASAMYQNLSSLLTPDALITIRTYGMTRQFQNRMYRSVDDHSSAAWHYMLCQIMMDFELGMLGAVFLTSAALGSVLTASDAGTFSNAMSSLLRKVSAVESGLQSVARPTSGDDPAPVAAYLPDSPATLKDISFSVLPGERVGVVGRTGAGKSSLVLSLKRLISQRQGSILRVLRERIFTIAQSPYLFAGSVRSVLDSDGVVDDNSLKCALESVGLSSFELSFNINEGGTNISQGQRQALYLARALLSRQKLIIMDEATGANALRETLPGSTLIVVAHCLATIADFDKILVLDEGRLIECGAPRDIYSKRGTFWNLVCHSPDGEELVEKFGGAA
ncbi:putative ABC bile acid transporter [Podospora aff. communis PSN243]|uniref:ABC bile acid transporter n=1 Tax=Podospora aff. communis PSN243 TaxID=3040156 RepID=A0AAV9H3H9_9PEZI|nr:putative ABC bile acid transporter [Podospora aff. communis PSN243]